MKKITVAYDINCHSWYVYTTNTKLQNVTRNVYWGCQRSPLRIFCQRRQPLNKNQQRVHCQVHAEIQQKQPIIGPLIGILTTRNRHGELLGNKQNFIDIINAGKKHGALVFVFTPDQVQLNTNQVQGYLYHHEKRWVPCRFPLPNIVYNRIPFRHLELQEKSCIEQLQLVPNLTLFNPSFFNKFDLYEWLKQCKSLAHYVPDTQLLQSRDNLKAMLKQHSCVYLKPIEGKAGVGIIKIAMIQQNEDAHIQKLNKRYALYFQKKQQSKVIYSSSLSSLWKVIQKLKTKSTYVIQQAIPLATYQSRAFDARTLIQKNKKGKWTIAGIGLRVAGKNRITTHVPRGGQIENPETVLCDVFSEKKATTILTNIRSLAKKIAIEIEKYYLHLGEMSLDIGIDEKGDLWFFEANAKPMKFDEPIIRKESLKNLIDYANYLTFSAVEKGVANHEH